MLRREVSCIEEWDRAGAGACAGSPPPGSEEPIGRSHAIHAGWRNARKLPQARSLRGGREVRNGRDALIFEGKTLDDAVRKGLEALGFPRRSDDHDGGGRLGRFSRIGARPYRVKVMPRPGGPIGESEVPGDRDGARRRGRVRPDARRAARRVGRGGRAGAAGGGSWGRGVIAPNAAASCRANGDARASGARAIAASRASGDARASSTRDIAATRATCEARAEAVRTARAAVPGDRGGRAPASAGVKAAVARRRTAGAGQSCRETRTRLRDGAARSERARSSPAGMGATPFGARARRREESLHPRRSEEQRIVPRRDLAIRGTALTEELLPARWASRRRSRPRPKTIASTSRSQLEERRGAARPAARARCAQALQHLLNLMLNRGRRARYHLQLEINDFWQQPRGRAATSSRAARREAATNDPRR